AKPLTAAITGLPSVSSSPSVCWMKRLCASPPTASSPASPWISAPAAKALSPAPVTMTPWIPASARASSSAVRSSVSTASLIALYAAGRLKVRYAMPSTFSYNRVSSRSAGTRVPWAAEATLRLVMMFLLVGEGSDEGAEPRDRLADDQILHLEGALIGIER